MHSSVLRAAAAPPRFAAAPPWLAAAPPSPAAAPPLTVAPADFRLPAPAEVAMGPPYSAGTVLYYWPHDGWVRGTAARRSRTPDGSGRGHSGGLGGTRLLVASAGPPVKNRKRHSAPAPRPRRPATATAACRASAAAGHRDALHSPARKKATAPASRLGGLVRLPGPRPAPLSCPAASDWELTRTKPSRLAP